MPPRILNTDTVTAGPVSAWVAVMQPPSGGHYVVMLYGSAAKSALSLAGVTKAQTEAFAEAVVSRFGINTALPVHVIVKTGTGEYGQISLKLTSAKARAWANKAHTARRASSSRAARRR